jgi:hypothetical protein
VEIQRVWTRGFGRGSLLGRAVDYTIFVIGALRLLLTQRDAQVVVSRTE